MKEFSNTVKGMVKDLENLSPDQYSHAYNLIMESYDGNSFLPSNDYSNIFGFQFIPGEDIIYKKYIHELEKIFLFTTKNRILALTGTYNDRGFNTYDAQEGSTPLSYDNSKPTLSVQVIASSECFNWSIQHKLRVAYKITDNTLNFYFVDGHNEDRYIYFNLRDFSLEDSFREVLSYDQYKQPQYGQEIDCNALKWNPEVSYPQIATKVVEGGELLAGTYQFLASFATSKGLELSGYKSSTNPLPLFTKKITDITNYNTGKAIFISIKGFEKVGRFRYINLVVAKTVNDVTTFHKVATLPIESVVNYTYTGNNREIGLDETIIFQTYPLYKSSKGLTKANNKLFKYGITEYEKFNLQPLAHKFKIKWFTVSAKLGSYAKPEFARDYRSNLRDEITPWGLKFILDNGQETPAILLIGRTASIDDLLPVIDSKDVIKALDDCNTKPFDLKRKWETYNTAYVTKTNEIKVDDCETSFYQEGEFAYWQSTETYPNDVEVWGQHAGKPIRHFKNPDCLVSPHYSNVDGQVVIHPLGVKLSDDVDVETILQEAVNQELITQQQKDRIRGYKIVRGNRTGNKSIQAKGLLFNTYQYLENGKQTVYPNYPFNDLRPDPFLSREKLKNSPLTDYQTSFYDVEFVENKKYTFHSPDTSFTNPSLGNILKVEQTSHGESKGFFNKSRKQGEYVILNQLHYNFAILIGWLLTSKLELEKGGSPATQGQTIGSGIGAVAGGIVGSFLGGVGAPLGAALGSALGSTIGKLVGGGTADNDYNEMYRLSMWVSQTDRILELLQNTMPMQNYHWQFQAVGNYDQYAKVENKGNKQRQIVTSAYLDSTRQLLPNEVYFNNNKRESSVYLELNEPIGVPSVQDTSRFTMSQKDCELEEGEEVKAKVSSQYVSIKTNVLNQYGEVNSIDWLPVSHKVWKVSEKFREFGGDTFIGGFGIKRKHAFFTNTAFKLPDRVDVYYEDLHNIGYPKYFFNTKFTELTEPSSFELRTLEGITNSLPLLAALNNIETPQSITGNSSVKNYEVKGTQDAVAGLFEKTVMNPYYLTRPGRYNLDCTQDRFVTPLEGFISVKTGNFWKGRGVLGIPNLRLDFTGVKGKIYTYSYGIPYFVVESDINVDLRHGENPNEGNFYPNITDLNYWLQEENVPITQDNKYTYNRTYSKQNKEDLTLKTDINFLKEKDKLFHENVVIYSQDGAEVENSSFRDNYLFFKPLDYFDFTYENGKLISVDAIESEQVLIRFENNMRIINALNTIPVNGAVDVALGTGSLFGGRPQEFSKTDSGYFGTQHTEILNTPFGRIWADSKRGNIFNLQTGGKGIDELTKDGMRNWMMNNLPFKISKYFDVDIDNSYNDIGITMSYDNRFKRFFLTKLDYVPRITGIEYRNNKFYYKDQEIRLNDGTYFCNASWTISYSFYTQSWTSFHSFTPNYYIDGIDLFYTGLNGIGRGDSSLWVHNATNKSYQRYYNKLYPFEIEAVTKYSLNPTVLTDISFKMDAVRYHNNNDISYVDDISFNKAIIYNEKQNSGLLHLNIIDKNNLFLYRQFPRRSEKHTDILLFKNETEFNFNQFEDLSIPNNLPRFINTCSNANKVLNLKAIDYATFKPDNNYIRGDKVFVRLINDSNDKYRIIFKGLISNSIPSVR